MTILVIGDLHYKISNRTQTEQFEKQVYELLSQKDCAIEHVMILGDVLHNHERLDTMVLNRVIDFVSKVSSQCHTTILVGNHDMVNNQVFCDKDGHWLNVLKHWKNVTIIDIPTAQDIMGFRVLSVPYVYPGRFGEALEKFNLDPKDFDFVFAHQEFRGALMGAIESKIGDDYTWNTPCISGHVHKYQSINNVLYTGSAFEHSFGSAKCFLFLINRDKNIVKIKSNVVGKTVINTRIENGKVNVKIPEGSTPSLFKCIINVEKVEDFHKWSNTEEAKLICKHFTTSYNLLEKQGYIASGHKTHNDLIATFKEQVANKFPEYNDRVDRLIQKVGN